MSYKDLCIHFNKLHDIISTKLSELASSRTPTSRKHLQVAIAAKWLLTSMKSVASSLRQFPCQRHLSPSPKEPRKPVTMDDLYSPPPRGLPSQAPTPRNAEQCRIVIVPPQYGTSKLPPGPQRFEYVYIPRNHRMARSEVFGLLVHVQYQVEFETVLHSLKIETLTDFDPLDPSNVSDPNYQDLTQDDRAQMAAQIHAIRCCRTIKFLRPSVARAVAQSFVSKGWISDDDVITLSARPSSHPFTAEDPTNESMSADLDL
ncbi:hypothetical protein BGW37DRAFT_545170 [Umbelopsis sp. PMI_123]|nr:hypothetical protein BGW37DRAFT_545170 [Umbelopsis sp. PMI_123]